MKIENDEITFSTGKVVSANNNIVGISPDDDATYGGYDDFIERNTSDIYYDEDVVLTNPERVELADYMIARWNRYKMRIIYE